MFIETKDMLRPKIYVIRKRKVYDVDYVSFDDKYYGVTEEDGLFDEYTFNEVALMDNTGYKDKNGKYIYEGSIVKNDVGIYTIKRSEGYKFISMYNGSLYVLLDEKICREIEVIGNIYENKEWVNDITKTIRI